MHWEVHTDPKLKMIYIKSALLALLLFSDGFAFTQPEYTFASKSNKMALKTFSLSKLRKKNIQLQSWGIGDDWSALSNAENEKRGFDPLDPASYYDSQLFGKPLEDISEQSPEDEFLSDTIDFIYERNGVQFPSETVPPLYDTAKSYDEYTKSVEFIDDAGYEISMLVRCNEAPEDLLIDEGRALLPLTDEERFDISYLVEHVTLSNYNSTTSKPKKEYSTTPFFDQSVSKIFYSHAVPKKISPKLERAVLDAKGLSAWMSMSLDEHVGQHDKRITAVISRYGTYGTGYLESFQFHQLYLDAVLTGITMKQKKSIKKFGGANSNMRQLNLKQPDVSSVWRDFTAHGIVSPAEREYKLKEEAIKAKLEKRAYRKSNHMLMDECEILDWGTEKKIPRNKRKKRSAQDDRERSSHELVDIASDGKTPKRLRDGSFGEKSLIFCF